jgi:hypothetical protein
MIELTYIENTFAAFANKEKGKALAELGDIDDAMRCYFPFRKKMEWAEFCTWMAEFADSPADPKDKKTGTPAVFPSIYQKDAETREAAFVQYNSNWMAFDIDDTVAFDDMLAFLKLLDCPYFLHTTTKHSLNKPRLRVIFHTNNEVDPDDWPKVWANMDAMFRAQFNDLPAVTDPKTRNINRIFYIPRKWNGTPAQYEYKQDGTPLDIWRIVEKFGIDPAEMQKVVSYEPNRMSQIRHDLFVSSDNELIPDHIVERAYAHGKTGRFFSLLVRAARRLIYKGYKVTAAELEQAALGIDRLQTGKTRTRSLQEAQKAINMAFSSWTDENPIQSLVTAEKNSGLRVDYIDAECGAGKSYQTLQRIAQEGGCYVYACDKILNIEQRRDELLKILGSKVASWNVVDIYYNKKNASGQDMDLSVTVQLDQQWQSYLASGKKDKIVIFISHAALKIYQLWQDWDDFELIIDEVPEITYTYTKNFKDTFDVFCRYVCTGSVDGGAYEMDLTSAGIDAVRSNSQDTLVQTFLPILQQIYYKNTKVWVKTKDWSIETPGKMEFFTVFTPQNLEGFKRVLLLGDQCAEMTITHTWKNIWNVDFVKQEFHSSRKSRVKPVKDRCKIFYFDRNRPSIKRAGAATQPANRIAEYLDKTERQTVLWTLNASARTNSKKLDDLLGADNAMSPKAHGVNDKQHYKAALWLAAMNPRDDQTRQYADYAGMSREDIIKDREYNAIYQFVMRTNLRDWDSSEFVNLYVWSEDQAEYLKERLNCPVEKIDDVIDEVVKKGGRKPSGNAMTDKQRGKKKRLMDKHGPYDGGKKFEAWMKDQSPNWSAVKVKSSGLDSASLEKIRRVNDE